MGTPAAEAAGVPIAAVYLAPLVLSVAGSQDVVRESVEFIRIVEQRDESTPLGKLVVALYDAIAAMEDLDPGLVEKSDLRQVELYKTYCMLQNEVLYADSYLRIRAAPAGVKTARGAGPCGPAPLATYALLGAVRPPRRRRRRRRRRRPAACSCSTDRSCRHPSRSSRRRPSASSRRSKRRHPPRLSTRGTQTSSSETLLRFALCILPCADVFMPAEGPDGRRAPPRA